MTYVHINQVANHGLSILLELKFNEIYNKNNLMLRIAEKREGTNDPGDYILFKRRGCLDTMASEIS